MRNDSHAPDYSEWLAAALDRRRDQYPAKPESGLISLVTSAYNTPVEFLNVLADGVMAQDFGVSTVFDWVLVDNGSTDPATVAALQMLAGRDCVRFFRVEKDLGIMGGMRYGVRRATGRYIVPLDPDDVVRRDTVRILASSIQSHRYPALLYSDEDKIDGNELFEAYFKPSWDPVLFFHSCYIDHLCAIDRGLAMLLGAYTDDLSRGCHDWDTFMRFFLAGYEPVHIPELMYSRRSHSSSCAGDIASKDYIQDSHRNTLQRFLDVAPHPERYILDYSPLFQRTPDWRIIRQFGPIPRLTTLVLNVADEHLDLELFRTAQESVIAVLDAESSIQSMIAVLQSKHADSGLVRLVCSDANPLFEDWFSEALVLLELFRETVMVGGPVYDGADRTLAAGMHFGFDGACGTPDRMRPRHDRGYFAQMWKPHSVSAVSVQHLIVDGAFLLDALSSGRIPEGLPLPCLGEWLGAAAARWKKRVVYSPFLAVRSETDWQVRWTEDERTRFAEANLDLIPDTRFYSRHLGQSMDNAYLPVMPDTTSLNLPQRSAVFAEESQQYRTSAEDALSLRQQVSRLTGSKGECQRMSDEGAIADDAIHSLQTTREGMLAEVDVLQQALVATRELEIEVSTLREQYRTSAEEVLSLRQEVSRLNGSSEECQRLSEEVANANGAIHSLQVTREVMTSQLGAVSAEVSSMRDLIDRYERRSTVFLQQIEHSTRALEEMQLSFAEQSLRWERHISGQRSVSAGYSQIAANVDAIGPRLSDVQERVEELTRLHLNIHQKVTVLTVQVWEILHSRIWKTLVNVGGLVLRVTGRAR